MATALKMTKRVENISQSIKVVNLQATELGLQQRVQVSTLVSIGVGGTHSLVDSSRVVGREADVRRVVDLLIGSTPHQSLLIVHSRHGWILVEILESLTRKPCEIKNVDVVLRGIQKELKKKSFLLVLDDVWDEDIKNWEDLRGSLQGINESKQSWILVTNRSENVALVRETPTDHRHRLKAVMDEECWSIFKERTFGNSPLSPELEAVG
ncbi:putative disease resistance RPP13-like protein 1 [Hibiscus syriacus]|uniref:putative disease resistance RPP13-like protein 1 n=1 Tax=Hibiscus syriacus TaxID=106335 RepID=UPI0019250364|nr:putative disease resistance RPP13-like protein 1 [Hibiscus syriacus]